MRKILSLLLSGALLSASLIALSSTSASAETALVTCTDFSKNKTIVLKDGQENCRPFQAAALWRVERSDTSINSSDASADLKVCSSKNPLFAYKFIKSKCPRFQTATDYRRAVVKPQTPMVITAAANGYSAAALQLATDTSTVRNYAPIAYYLITNLMSNEITRVAPDALNRLFISGLNPLTTYTFQIAAVNIDGTSALSLVTPQIMTTAVPVAPPAPAAAPVLAAPAFTISSSSESKPVNSTITGYTITTSGGAIASYSISPAAPAGLTFSTSTGLLSGTPTSVASATAYTITATNTSGSATRTFTMTVTSIIYAVGDTGPGGGKIFYVATTPFACGPTRTATCTYLEAAPPALGLASFDTATAFTTNRSWAQFTPVNYQSTTVPNFGDTTTAQAIGFGYRNTRAIIVQGNSDSATSAAALADSHTVTVSGVVYDDWFLPSKDELNQMCKWARGITGDTLTTLTTVCTGGTLNSGLGASGFVGNFYWSSSEYGALGAWGQFFSYGYQYNAGKDVPDYVRPVRAF
jgi:hypothetical protein